MANTRVGISTISDELLEHIRTEVKAVLNWSDLNDAPGYAGQGGKFLEAFSGGGDSGIQWSSLPPQGLSWINANADVTATDKIGYMAAGGITITLPADPVVGNLVAVADRDSSFAVSPVTVLPTGTTIEGDTDLVLDLRNAYIQLIFDGTQWQISQVNHPYNVNEITEEQHVFSAANNIRDITLGRQAPSRSSVIVIRNGSILSTTEYSLAGNVLTLNFVPRSETISVRHIGIPAATRVADVPVGFMGYFPNNNVPAGWLRTIGGTVTRAMYPELVTFLTGNPAAEVATLPDSRGDFVRCYDFGAGTDTTQVPSQLITNELGRWMTTTFPGTTENLWDGNTSTTTTVNFADQAIGYSFDAPTVINSITLFNAEPLGAQYLPSQIRLQYSDDGGVWFDASAVVPGNTNNALVTIASTELAAHRHWRVLGAGGLQHPNSDQYWTVATLQFFGTMQARVIGSQQGASVGEMNLTVDGTPYGIGQVPTGAGTSALVANGTGVAAGGIETRPANVSYVLCIKSSHYQNGELGTEDLNNVLTEIAQIRSEASDSRSYVQPTPPENPVDNARWYDTESGRTYIWFNDGNSYQWVDDSPQSAAQTAQAINAAEILSVGSTTPRALNERFADVVNVKDFGAVGDGVADDNQAFIDAFATATLTEGNTVVVPRGEYVIHDLVVPVGIKLLGTGGAATPFGKYQASSSLLYDEVSKGASILKVLTGTNGLICEHDTDKAGIEIENIAIEGPEAGGSQFGLSIRTQSVSTKDVTVNRFPDGVGVEIGRHWRATHYKMQIRNCGIAMHLNGNIGSINGISWYGLLIEESAVGIYHEGAVGGLPSASNSFISPIIEALRARTAPAGYTWPSHVNLVQQFKDDTGMDESNIFAGVIIDTDGGFNFVSLYTEAIDGPHIWQNTNSKVLLSGGICEFDTHSTETWDGIRFDMYRGIASFNAVRFSYTASKFPTTPIFRVNDFTDFTFIGNKFSDEESAKPYYVDGHSNPLTYMNGLYQTRSGQMKAINATDGIRGDLIADTLTSSYKNLGTAVNNADATIDLSANTEIIQRTENIVSTGNVTRTLTYNFDDVSGVSAGQELTVISRVQAQTGNDNKINVVWGSNMVGNDTLLERPSTNIDVYYTAKFVFLASEWSQVSAVTVSRI